MSSETFSLSGLSNVAERAMNVFIRLCCIGIHCSMKCEVIRVYSLSHIPTNNCHSVTAATFIYVLIGVVLKWIVLFFCC